MGLALSSSAVGAAKNRLHSGLWHLPAGAQAYRRDNPNAKLKLLDAVHFALETNVEEIAAAIAELLSDG